MDTKTATLIITAIINLLLGFIVLSKNPKKNLYKFFFGITFGVFLWAGSSILNHLTQNYTLALYSTRISFLSALIVTAFLALFSYTFSNEKIRNKRLLLIIVITTLFSSCLTLFTDAVVKDVVLPKLNIVEKGIEGNLLIFFIIQVIVYLGFSFITLIQKYKKSEGIIRIQIYFFFIGTLFCSFFAILATLILPFIFKIQIFAPLGSVSTIILMGLIAYSIIRYRFLDIRLTIRQSLIRFLLIFIFTALFSTFIWMIKVFTHEINIAKAILAAFLSTVIGLSLYDQILKLIRSLFSQFLFQKDFTREEFIKTLGKTIHESIDLDHLLENLKDALQQILNPQFVTFVLFKSQKEQTEIYFASQNISLTEKMVKILTKTTEIIVRDEIPLLLQDRKISAPLKELFTKIEPFMKEKDIQVIIPLPGHNEMIGVIALGEKKYNEAYTINDISILETLRYQAGIAIENAIFYNEVKSFSQELKREVSTATKSLTNKNRFLNVLQQVDHIIMNTLDLDEMCQKIVDMVAWEMGYSGALIALIDPKKNILQTQAISDTPSFHAIKQILPKQLKNFSLSLEQKDSLLIKVLEQRELKITTSLAEIYCPPLTTKEIVSVETLAKIKTHFVFPLSAKGKSLGVIVIGLPKAPDKIMTAEKELLQAFVEEVGIAIESVTLYENLSKMNNELVQANNKLKELDQMKDEFVSVASHELRTPMTAIKGYAWMLQKGKYLNRLNQKQKEYLEKIVSSTNRLISLVNDILDVSRIEGGKIKLNLEAGSIDEVIEEVITEIQPKAMDKNLVLSFKKEGIIPSVLIEKKRVYEIIMNLIGNAIKFTPEAGKITLSRKEKGKMIEISVSDTGRGIAKNDIPKLFKKFGRLEHSFALISESSGTGLGLYITKALVELHGGKIRVTSKVGQGSTFTFSLRIAKR